MKRALIIFLLAAGSVFGQTQTFWQAASFKDNVYLHDSATPLHLRFTPTNTTAAIDTRLQSIEGNTHNWNTVLQSMTNYTAVSSSTNYLAYDAATRTLSGCVTNGGAGGGLTEDEVRAIEPLMTNSTAVSIGGGFAEYLGVGISGYAYSNSVAIGSGSAAFADYSVAIGGGVINNVANSTKVAGDLYAEDDVYTGTGTSLDDTYTLAVGISNAMFRADGTTAMSGDINAGGNAITNAGALQMPVMDTMSYTGAVPFLAWNPESGMFEQAPNATMETYSRTIHVATNESIQAAIDGIGKYIPYGVVVTVQPAAGTHTVTGTITLRGFHGPGTIRLAAESYTSSANTNQNVFLDGSSYEDVVLSVYNVTCSLEITGIKIAFKSNAKNNSGIYFTNSKPVYSSISYCYIYGNSTSYGFGLQVHYGSSVDYVRDNVFANMDKGIRAVWSSRVFARGNQSTGIDPTSGYSAEQSGIIHIYSATAGIGGSREASLGGILVQGSGAVLP